MENKYFCYDDERIVCRCCKQLKPLAQFNQSSLVCDSCVEQLIDVRRNKTVRTIEVDEQER